MPMYDFYCPACQNEFEEIVSSDQIANVVCPNCHSKEVQQKISAPSPLRKGAFPFKVGPVRPLSQGAGPSPCATCNKH